MKKSVLLLAFLLGTSGLFAQQADSTLVQDIFNIKEEITKQEEHLKILYEKIAEHSNVNHLLSQKWNNQQYIINQQNSSIDELIQKSKNQEKTIDSLNQLIITNHQNIKINSKELGTKIQETGEIAYAKISQLDSNIEENRLYWIFATLGTFLLGGIMYLFLGKQITTSKADVETQIKNTKKSLEEEGLKLDKKLVEVLETQLKLKQEKTKAQTITKNEKEDHSLALKVADEIVRMQKNISRMDPDTKGLKPLEKGIERIQSNFAANGYEMVNLLNSDYDERMNIDVINFIEDENLAEGKKIVSRIVKPQVNFNGVLIQRAQVEVSQN
jgi:hypothetical protein